MNLQTQPDSLDPKIEECLRLQKCWLWFLVLGAALVAVGVAAVTYATFATLTTVLVFGSLLLAGGVVQIVNAFLLHTWRGFFLHLLAGILHLVIGGLLIDDPIRGAEALTFMLAAIFMVSGVVRILIAVQQRFSGWGWVLANGVVTLMLGVAVWRRWPDSAYWVIGVVIGIDLIFNGWSWVMLGLIVKSARLSPQLVEPKAPPAVPTGTM